MNQGKVILKLQDFQKVYDFWTAWNEKKLDADKALIGIEATLRTEFRKETHRRERLTEVIEK